MTTRKDLVVSQGQVYWLIAVRETTHQRNRGHLADEGKDGVAVGFGAGWSLGEVQVKPCFDGLQAKEGCV